MLLVKCLGRDGKTHGGWEWPRSGPVESPEWDGQPTCDGGGLFGWPWGIGIGSGREPDACAPWLVWAAAPETLIAFDGKAKAPRGEVVYYGDMAGAIAYTIRGRIAWIKVDAAGSAATSGDRSSAAASGDRSSAAASGYSSSAAASGYGSSAAASTGANSIASVTGSDSTVEVGPGGIAAATVPDVTWRVRRGGLLIQRWDDGPGKWGHAVLDADALSLPEGLLRVVCGQIVPHDGKEVNG